MLPPFVTVKATGPAGTVVADSRIVHSDSSASTGAGLARRAGMAAARAATAPTSSAALELCLICSILKMGWHR